MSIRFRRQRRREMGCFGSVLFSLIFLGMGLGVSWWGWGVLSKAKASVDWPITQGQITESYVRTNTDSDGTTYSAQLEYEYVVNDQVLTAYQISFGEYSSSNRSRAQEIVNRYPVGQPIPVAYDPNEPTTAVLEPGVTTSSYFILGMGVCLSFVPLLLLFNSIRRGVMGR